MIQEKKSYAKFFGATNFIDTKKNDIIKIINKISQGKGLDYAIDTTGKKETMEAAYNCVNKFSGHAILCGVPNPLSLKNKYRSFSSLLWTTIERHWRGRDNS